MSAFNSQLPVWAKIKTCADNRNFTLFDYMNFCECTPEQKTFIRWISLKIGDINVFDFAKHDKADLEDYFTPRLLRKKIPVLSAIECGRLYSFIQSAMRFCNYKHNLSMHELDCLNWFIESENKKQSDYKKRHKCLTTPASTNYATLLLTGASNVATLEIRRANQYMAIDESRVFVRDFEKNGESISDTIVRFMNKHGVTEFRVSGNYTKPEFIEWSESLQKSVGGL